MKIAILIDQLYQDSEVLSPLEELKKSGYEVHVIGASTEEVYVGKLGAKIKADKSIDEINPKDYAGIVIPGGWAPDKMRMNTKMVSLIKELNSKNKPIASICHGGWMLVEADIVRGKTVTSYLSVKTDLKNAGATWIDSEVVVDRNLVTSRKPDDLPAFNREFIQLLSKVAV